MKLKIYSYFNNNKNNNNKNIEILKIIYLSCSVYFERNVKNENNCKNEYIVISEKGIFHFDKSPFHLDSKEGLDKYNKYKTNFKTRIKNYIILTLNKIFPNGKDKLDIDDTKIQKITKEIKSSFASGINGLKLIEI